MDRKTTLIGLGLIVAGFLLFVWQARQMEEYHRERRLQDVPQQEQQPLPADETVPGTRVDERGPSIPTMERPAAIPGAEDATSTLRAGLESPEGLRPAQRVTLQNEYIRVTFTTRGGAIEAVEFLRTDPENPVDRFVFNAISELPAMALSFRDTTGRLQPFLADFEILRQRDDLISFRVRQEDGLSLVRTFRLGRSADGDDPYLVRHETLLENSSDSSKSLPILYLNLGTAEPLARDAYSVGEFLNFSYRAGSKTHYLKSRRFTGSGGFLGFGGGDPQPQIQLEVPGLEWAAVKNQFFVAVMNEVIGEGRRGRARAIHSASVDLPVERPGENRRIGITGKVGYELEPIPAQGSVLLGTEYYIGPKELIRLQRLGQDQDKLMQYWGPDIIAQSLHLLLFGIHKLVPSWGWSIILMTLLIKLLFWPLTSKGMRAQKINAVKMAPLQSEMKTLREKYRDNPKGLQSAMASLYKKHDVNPLAMMGGCLPILIQIPIFIGLFAMLRVAPELRFSSFLWIRDLSQADTIAQLGTFPVNLMPLIYAVAMYAQMSMTPMPETADETQRMTFRMMKIMPFFFLFFFYTMPAALPLYFTTQALLTMGQQHWINKRLQPEIDAIKARQKSPDGSPPEPKAKPAVATKAKPKEEKKPAPSRNPIQDGLGATRRLKGGSGKPTTPPKRKRRR